MLTIHNKFGQSHFTSSTKQKKDVPSNNGVRVNVFEGKKEVLCRPVMGNPILQYLLFKTLRTLAQSYLTDIVSSEKGRKMHEKFIHEKFFAAWLRRSCW